jgi:sulfate adenylyltransferase subunit 1 (EFTu-like GTPase family)
MGAVHFMKLRSYCVLGFLLAAALSLQAQRGALTVHRTLDALTEQAATIVRGHVISAHVEPHPQYQNLQTLVVEMQVDSVLKGNAGKTFTYRQYIWDIRDKMDSAGYKKGQEVLLLLNPVSDIGLTSPVGMEQGKFHITRVNGKATAVNGMQNAGLFAGVQQAAAKKGVTLSSRAKSMVQKQTAGPVALEDLEDTIRSLARAK